MLMPTNSFDAKIKQRPRLDNPSAIVGQYRARNPTHTTHSDMAQKTHTQLTNIVVNIQAPVMMGKAERTDVPLWSSPEIPET